MMEATMMNETMGSGMMWGMGAVGRLPGMSRIVIRSHSPS